tara:strand:+ start:1191 stop:2246 length:1056 start_codon:yes stop_codon:yes gene_type:complete
MTTSVHKSVVVAGGKASATITVGINVADETIIIVDAAGTSKTYKSHASNVVASLYFINTNAIASATGLAAALVHANGHNGTITVSRDDAVLTLTQTVAGPEGNKGNAFGSGTGITNTLTATTFVDFAGGTIAEANDKGTIANAGTVSGSKFQGKSLIDTNQGSRASGAKVVARTGSSYVPGIAKGNSSGTLAYSGPTTRSKADTGFVIRSGVANKISGVAINPILSGGSDTTSRKSGNIAYRAAYHSKGLLSGQIFNLYRDPTSAQPYRGGVAGGDGGLRQDDNTAKSGISGWGTSRALAADSAAVVGFGAAPKAGEFYILQNFVSFTGTSISGDGTSSENMMDYSAVTGG